jgi:hypothetical protein
LPPTLIPHLLHLFLSSQTFHDSLWKINNSGEAERRDRTYYRLDGWAGKPEDGAGEVLGKDEGTAVLVHVDGEETMRAGESADAQAVLAITGAGDDGANGVDDVDTSDGIPAESLAEHCGLLVLAMQVQEY